MVGLSVHRAQCQIASELSVSAPPLSMSEQQRGLVYLLTGGCGFLGRHLLRLLLEKEDKLSEVRVFDKHVDTTVNGLSTGETFKRPNFIQESANLKF